MILWWLTRGFTLSCCDNSPLRDKPLYYTSFSCFLGGHINPAVSLALAVCGRFPWKKLPFYMLAQFIGAFIACACVFGVYHGKWDA